VLQLWGGSLREAPVGTPEPPKVVSDDGSGKRVYSLVAVAPQGKRGAPSKPVEAGGLAVLRWDSVTGADAYVVLRDGKEVTGLLRIEGLGKRERLALFDGARHGEQVAMAPRVAIR
jgi:hypothetical protein